jgi:acyl-coenzyme A synthetase/AMP-(fatty) acid ligase
VVSERELPPYEELRIELRGELAPYEIPRRIVRVEALPRTENGKLDRPGVLRRIDG